MKNLNQITEKLIGLPTQLTISDKFVSFTANTKTLVESGEVIKAPVVCEISKLEGVSITEKRIGKARKNIEFIDGKTQETIWQMVKYTVQVN